MPTGYKDPPFRIDYGAIAAPLKQVPDAICARLQSGPEREILERDHEFLPVITKWTVKIAAATYRGAKQLVADETALEDRFKNVVCVPVLTRALLENLFSFVYLFDAPKENVRRHLIHTWRDGFKELEHLREKHDNDPDFADYIKEYSAMVDSMAKDAGLNKQERASLQHTSDWPLPGQMIRQKKTGGRPNLSNADRQTFLEYVHKNFYGTFSADAHSSGLGFVRRGSILMEGTDSDVLTLRLSQNFFMLLTVYVALMSEIVGQLKLTNESGQLASVWNHIDRWPEAKELFEFRYRDWLNSAV